jgi:hypothetical protein
MKWEKMIEFLVMAVVSAGAARVTYVSLMPMQVEMWFVVITSLCVFCALLTHFISDNLNKFLKYLVVVMSLSNISYAFHTQYDFMNSQTEWFGFASFAAGIVASILLFLSVIDTLFSESKKND